jgi:hypothetical protein
MKPHKKLESLYDYLINHYRYNDGKIIIVNHSQKRRINTVLNGSLKRDGYISVSILNQSFKEHRVIFLLVHGYLPEYIDHINQNKVDNRIENLRPATTSQNMGNVRKFKKNPTSKFKGVSFHKIEGKWISHIRFKDKLTHIGYFKNEEDAAREYDKKAIELFGTFACTNF